jgi:hypothetical protein
VSGDTSTPVGDGVISYTAPATGSNSFTTSPIYETTNYWVRVTNSSGYADSTTATVSVNAGPGVTITSITSKMSTPGSNATIRGTGFSTTAKRNTVKFGTLKRGVGKKGTATTLAVTIPKKCKKGTTYQVVVTVSGMASNPYPFTVK